MAQDKLQAKVKLTDRVTWIHRSADRLVRMVELYQVNKQVFPLLRSEAWITFKRSWELMWHLWWVKYVRKER